MTDRVYPSSTKPTPPPKTQTQHPIAPTTTTGTLPTVVNPPPNKSANLYNPNRHPYRPNPTNRHHTNKHKPRSSRRCICLTCFWTLLILLTLLFLAIIAGAAFYVLYHPERPTFSVTSLKISSFNITKNPSDDVTHLTTKLNLTISVKNSNKKVIFFYDPVSVSVMSRGVMLGNGSFSNFTSNVNSVFVMHTVMGTSGQTLADDDSQALDKDVKRRSGVPMNIVVDTNVGVKMEKLKMKKVGIRVKCEGIRGVVPPKGRIVTPVVANTVKAKCKVDLRVKIWKFTF